MAVTHPTTIRNGIADYVVDQVDSGGAGSLEFQTAGDVEVATIALQNPAFGDAAAGVATLQGVPLEDSSATGNASNVTKFVIKSGGAADVIYGAVGTSGSDINLNKVLIDAGDIVRITSLTYTAPN